MKTPNMSPKEITEAYKKYQGHCRNCRNKKDRNGDRVEMRMTFDEWLKIWVDSGHWHERGVIGYVMARHNDIGHYEIGNVKIISAAKNISDANTGRVRTEQQRDASRKAGKLNLGRKASEETRKKMSLAHLGKTNASETRAINMRGIRWWTNGEKVIRARECPPGFVSGRKM